MTCLGPTPIQADPGWLGPTPIQILARLPNIPLDALSLHTHVEQQYLRVR
jgi:hypothetical protein